MDATISNPILTMIQSVPFKDCSIQTDNKMTIKMTIRFIRSGEGEDRDDVIIIHSTPISDMLRVVYTPADSSSGSVYTTYMSRSGVLTYVSDILRSMEYDVDPFDRIQLSTDLHPSVMYSAADMEDIVARRNFENLVHSSLRTTVVRRTQ